jgi:hypothetical protein
MKRLGPLMLLSLVACGRNEAIRSSFLVLDKPLRVAGTESKLQVPDACPLYIPGGGDADTIEGDLSPGISGICAVDDQGNAYGIMVGDGDSLTLPPLAILPGNREIGVYIGFTPGDFIHGCIMVGDTCVPDAAPTTDQIKAFASPTSNIAVTTNAEDCCAEDHPEDRIPVEMVAYGDQGILFSLGTFDLSPIQVAYQMYGDGVNDVERFYVNGVPPL